ncbi:MAG: energy-coupling factor transporter ATPase [Clostridia bacterium]
MQAVEIKNLTFTYSKKTPFEKTALDNVNLSIEEGSFVGIIGATGSGKSTLIQHLNGLIKQQDKKNCSIVVDGLDARDKKTLKKLRFAVGMVFQYPEYQLFEDSVAKDIAFGPKNMKLTKEEVDKRVHKAMEVVGLPYDNFADRSPFDLSGGEKRRAAIAGVIAMQPKILVLDEPVAGLDPVGRVDIISLIKKLQKEVSPTIIMVSHNMDDIAVLADRIIALQDGKIVADGTPSEVFSDRENIKKIGLDTPTATRLSDCFIAKGYDLPHDIVTMESLKLALKSIKEKSGNLADKKGVEPRV